jgi:hypothetical protein
MCRKLLLLAGPGIALMFSACGGLQVTYAPRPTPTPSSPVVGVSVSPANANVNGLKSQLFTAQVTGTNNAVVIWSLSGTGCNGSSCGSIAANGVYKAPASVPVPASVIVTATSVADSTKSATALVTLLAALPVEVDVTPRTATVLANKNMNLAAAVTNALNTGVTWTVAGSGCTGVACGTISPSGVYTAPVAAPAPGAVTVTATSQADPAKADQASITVVDTADALITGTYIYLLNSRSFGGGFAAVGSITFQPGGKFTASEDGEFSSGSNNPDTWSGTYTIGTDGRGTVTGTGLHIGTRVLQISVLPADEIRFVQVNNTGQRTSGVMRRANATGASLAGDWAFEFSGTDGTGGPLGMIGRLQLDTGGNIIGLFTLNSSAGFKQGQLTGNYVPPLAGRSTVQLVGLGQTLAWVLYDVNDRELFWVMDGSRDPVITELSGSAVRRTGTPFAASSLDATTVLRLTGNGAVSAGTLAFDGAISASGIRDQRPSSGTVIQNAPATTTYSVDPSSGCGDLSIQFAAGVQRFNMCLIAPNQGFVLQPIDPTTANGFLGEFSRQVGPSSAGIPDGTYNFGSEWPGDYTAGLAVGILNSNSGTLSGIADITLPGGDTTGQAVSGSITSFDPATGRGTATLNLPGMSSVAFYIISSGRLALLPMTAGTPGVDAIGSVISSGH